MNNTKQYNETVKHDDAKDRNENTACKRRICKISDQPKIDRIANNDARLILRKKPGHRHDRIQTESQQLQPWTAVSTLLGLVSTV